GALYDPAFLRVVSPLYDMHMGCENMGPLLYSLVRFLKPKRVLEIGAGLTSIFLLQALVDNEKEEEAMRRMRGGEGGCKCEGVEWSVDGYFEEKGAGGKEAMLHIVDNMEHEATTAHLVMDAAKTLGISRHLNVVVADCYELEPGAFGDEELDFVWLDGISTDERFEGLYKKYWKNLKCGGHAAVHSTLTNTTSKAWLSKIHSERSAEASKVAVDFHVKIYDPEETDLETLAGNILGSPKVGGGGCEGNVEFTGKYRLEEVGYGIKKLVLAATADSVEAGENTAEIIAEIWEADIQSVDVEETRQNSFTIMQKREGYIENTYSWSP
ncbi:hypothetical protein TrRE_jg12644, partial [Triparma retinervis]